MSTGEPTRACAECGATMAAGQAFCVDCGARAGGRDPLLVGLLSAEPGEAGGPPAEGPDAANGRGQARGLRWPELRFPSPWVSALLVTGFLGFGILLGNVVATPPSGELAADAGQRVRLELPAKAPPAEPSTPATSPNGSESAPEEASAPEAQPAPTPVAATPSKPASRGSSDTEASAGDGKTGTGAVREDAPAKTLPPIKHVFLIMLADEPYGSSFGPASPAHYLTGTLEDKGELLARYDAVAHEGLGDEIALMSGQGPTAEVAADCPTYVPLTPTGVGASEQVLGSGCVYPASTETLPGELAAHRLSWRAYVEGMDEPGAQAGPCAHPALGQPDPTAAEGASSGPYATFRNPFVYLGAIVQGGSCAADDVGVNQLEGDLSSSARTPSLAYIVPDRCKDGNPTPCSAGAPAGMAPADGFLKAVVPEIMRSKAYRSGGLIVITADDAPSSGEFADSSSCCGQPTFPNLPPNASGLPRGGGTVGALLISPYVKGGVIDQERFNDFSLLRTIEDLFGVKHLGYAGLATVKDFEASMFLQAPASSR